MVVLSSRPISPGMGFFISSQLQNSLRGRSGMHKCNLMSSSYRVRSIHMSSVRFQDTQKSIENDLNFNTQLWDKLNEGKDSNEKLPEIQVYTDEHKYFDDKINHSQGLPMYQIFLTKHQAKEKEYKTRLDPEDFEIYKRGDFEPSLFQMVSLKWGSIYCIARNYFDFFKAGCMNLYYNNRALKRFVFNKYYLLDNGLGQNNDVGKGEFRDKKASINIRKLDLITNELANAVFCTKVKSKSKKNINELYNSENDPISITRSQYQAMIRSKKDFIKLPFFGILFLILEELVIPLCYIFPSLMPSTCVVPMLLPRFLHKGLKAQKKLEIIREKEFQNLNEDEISEKIKELKRRTPYSLSSEELRLTVDLLSIHRSVLNRNDDSLRELLIQRYKEIQVDNYLLIRDGGVYKMDKLELFFGCLNRGLLDFREIVEMTKTSKGVKPEEEKSFYEKMDETELRDKLLRFLYEMENEMEKSNTGLLGVSTTCKFK